MIKKAIEDIDVYLKSGGLFNPELANHNAVRDLIISTKEKLILADEDIQHYESILTKAGLCLLCGKPDWGVRDRHEYTKHGTNCPKD